MWRQGLAVTAPWGGTGEELGCHITALMATGMMLGQGLGDYCHSLHPVGGRRGL